MGFTVTFSNVLLTLIYIIPGYIICKAKKAAAEHLSTLSSVLVYILSPCMIISSFISIDYSTQNLINMGLFFVTVLVLQGVFMLILFLIFRKKYEDGKYRILTIGSVLGNVGFFGLPIIKALLPEYPEVVCYSSVYVVAMNIIVFTVGVFCLTNDKKFMSVKSIILNPSTLSFFVALPLFIFGAKNWLPELVIDGVSLLGKATTPVCMIILGIRLASVSFKKLFARPVVYIICLCKLVIFPLFCYLCVYFIPFEQAFKTSVLILSGTPCASVISGLAEIHHSETELSANCILLSTLLCIATVPLLTLLV
ncbi:MAG: AEC family transporter [Candidatus Coproplasma sp.]